MPSAVASLSILPTTKPFKSSYLAVPPSPFSPKLPVEDPHSPPPRRTHRAIREATLDLPPPPPKPLDWLWKCHKCNRVYRLGTTRRCLDDGHYFCAGTTTIKRSRRSGKKVVKHQACASEFDYAAWKSWGTWRRDALEQVEAARALNEFLDFGDMSDLTQEEQAAAPRARQATTAPHKDCWNTCDYPSECRWGKQYGIVTSVLASSSVAPQTTLSTPSISAMDSVAEEPTQTTFDEILFDMSDIIGDPMEGVDPTPETPIHSPTSPTEAKKPSMDDLLASVKRRKRKSTGAMPSPLSSHPPSPVLTGSEAVDSLMPLPPGPQRSSDDFDLDLGFRSSIGRAGEAVGSLLGVRSFRSTSRWGKKRNGTGTW